MTWVWLLPDAFLPIVVAGLGLLVIVGVMSVGRAIAIVLGLVLLPLVVDVLIGAAFDVLPAWVLVVGCVILGFALARQALESLLGEHAAGHVIGHFVIHAIVGSARLLFLPLRLVGWLLGRAWR